MQNRKQSKLNKVKREAPFLSAHYLLPNPQLSFSKHLLFSLPASCMHAHTEVCLCVYLCVYLKKNQTRVPGSFFSVVHSSRAVQRRLQAHGPRRQIARSEFPFRPVRRDKGLNLSGAWFLHLKMGSLLFLVLWKFLPWPGLWEQSGLREVCNQGRWGRTLLEVVNAYLQHVFHLSADGLAKNKISLSFQQSRAAVTIQISFPK